MADPKEVRDALATAAAVDGDATKMSEAIAEKIAPEKAAGEKGEESDEYDDIEHEEEEETGGFEDEEEEEEEEEGEEEGDVEKKQSLTALLLGGEGGEEEEEEEEDEYREEDEDAAATPYVNGNGIMPAAKAEVGEKRTRDENEDEDGVEGNVEQGAKKLKA